MIPINPKVRPKTANKLGGHFPSYFEKSNTPLSKLGRVFSRPSFFIIGRVSTDRFLKIIKHLEKTAEDYRRKGGRR